MIRMLLPYDRVAASCRMDDLSGPMRLLSTFIPTVGVAVGFVSFDVENVW